jgi:hypothetical protein
MWTHHTCFFARDTWIESHVHRYRSWSSRLGRLTFGLVLLLVTAVVPKLSAQSTEEFDSYKLKLEGFWVYSTPTGKLQGSADSGTVDLTKDLNFENY